MAPVETAYYELLESPPEATADELSSAYRKRALKLHPDKGGSEEQFKAMKAAYDVLKDPQKRKMYDTHGAAIVRAMDGEVLEPEVMLEVVLSVTKSASKMVLFILPIAAVILLFPAVALSLKWDQRIALNWTLVFVPLWIVHVIVLVLLLQLRAVMSTTMDTEASEDEVDAQERKRKVRLVFTVSACMVILLLVQEVLMAAKLQGDMKASWFLVLIPFLTFELSMIYMRVRLLVGTLSAPKGAVATMLASTVWWASLRLSTVALIAAKADGRIACTWTLCLIPMVVGASCKLLWSCRTQRMRRAAGEEYEEASQGSSFFSACVTIALWLSMLLLGAGKLDGREYSAFLVFLPFFLVVAQLLCCCTCLACCGPLVLTAFLEEEKKQARERPDGEAQTLNPTGIAGQDYSTLP